MKFYNLFAFAILALGFAGCAPPPPAQPAHKMDGTRLTWEQQQKTWETYKNSMRDVVSLTKNPADLATERFILEHGQLVDDRVGARPLPPKGKFYIIVINGDELGQTKWEQYWAISPQTFASFFHPDNVLCIKSGGLPVSDKLKGTMLLHEGSHAERNLFTSYEVDDHAAFINDELLAYEQQIPEVRAVYGKGYSELRPRVLAVAREVVKLSPERVFTIASLQDVCRPFLDDAHISGTKPFFGLPESATFNEVGIPFQYLAYDCMFKVLEETSKSAAEAREKKRSLIGSIYGKRN
jgi:hypothetical protein